jgi:hypothetical protein
VFNIRNVNRGGEIASSSRLLGSSNGSAMRQVNLRGLQSDTNEETRSFLASTRDSAINNLNNRSSAVTTTNDMDIVDELVEQALVDNLLDGNIYSAHSIQHAHTDDAFVGVTSSATDTTAAAAAAATVVSNLRNTTRESSLANVGLTADSESISSGTGRAVSSMVTSPSLVNSTELTSSNENRSTQATADSSSSSSTTTSTLACGAQLKEDFINLFIRFVNEKEIKIKVKPEDTILLLKR